MAKVCIFGRNSKIARLGVYAAALLAGLTFASGDVFAAKIPNSTFSTQNLKIYKADGTEIPDGGNMTCNTDYSMEFDFSIESETPLHTGDKLTANMRGPSNATHIPVNARSGAPVNITNQSGSIVATWQLDGNNMNIVIKEAGDGIQSLSGHINTGKNLVTETCTTKEIDEEFKVDWTSGAGPQDSKTLKLSRGVFSAQPNHYLGGTLTTSRINIQPATPNMAINSLYKSRGQNALSSNEIMKDLWMEVESDQAFDSMDIAIYARAVTPAGSYEDTPNMDGGISYNGINVSLANCGDSKYPCKQRVDMNAGETKEAYIQRLRETQGNQAIIPYGRIGDAVIIYYGDIPNTNPGMTYADALNSNKEGVTAFAQTVAPYHSQAVWQAVDQAIGPDNIYGGPIVLYSGSISLFFTEPFSVPGQQASATSTWHYVDGNDNTKTESKSISRSVSIGSSDVAVEKGTASLQLIDANSKAPIAGADFKLQKQDNGNWVDVDNSTRTTDNSGKIQVISLEDGTYRWVQTSLAAEYYEQNNTRYFEDANLASEISSFVLDDEGYGAIATNTRKSYLITFAGGDHAASDFSNIVKTQFYGDNTYIPSSSDIRGETGWIFDGWDKEIASKVTENATYTAVWKKEQTSVRGNVVWLDANDEDGLRPSSLGVNLVQNGHTVDRSANVDGSGLFEIRNLDKYDSFGEEYDYSVNTDASGYNVEVEKNANGTFTVKLSHSPVVDITITKVWNDGGLVEMRPEDITFNLLVDGRHAGQSATIGKNETSATISGVAKYSDLAGSGTLITYSLEEDSVDFYGISIQKDSAYAFTVTNTLEDPEAATYNASISVAVEDGVLDNGRSANVVLTPVSDGAPMPSDATDGKKSVPVGTTPNIGFGEIEFDEGGAYQYKISLETNPATIGDNSGNNEYTLVVHVLRNPNTNKLEVVGEDYFDAEGNPIHPKDVSFDIAELDPIPTTENVSIQLPTDSEIDENSIEATVSGKGGAPMPEGAEDGSTSSFVNPDGTINVGDITFTEPGEFEYDIKLNSDDYDIDTDEFTIVVKVELDESTNQLSVSGIVAIDSDGNEISLDDLKLGIRRRDAENPDTSATNIAPLFVVFGATVAGTGALLFTRRRRL